MGGLGRFAVDLGTRVCSNQVRQAPGERGVTLVAATSALANDAVQLVGVDGAGAYSLGSTDLWQVGEVLAGLLTAGSASSGSAGQGHLEAPVVRFVSFPVGMFEVGTSVFGRLGKENVFFGFASGVTY